MDLNGFNAAEVEPSGTYTPIPPGDYKCVIAEAEEKPNKAGTGSYLQLGIEVIDGPSTGRKLIDRLNIKNPNQTAVDIANATLSAICHATGIMTPKHSSELLLKPIMVKVAVSPGNDQYGPGNEVKGYSAVKKAAPAAPTEQAASTPWG